MRQGKTRVAIWIGYILIIISVVPSLIILVATYKENLEKEFVREISSQESIVSEYDLVEKDEADQASEMVK